MDSRTALILDVDTGVDDALAVAWAATRSDVELLAVTTVSGNVDVVKATENTRRVLGFVGASQVPVHRGATRPLIRSPRHATDYHGNNGVGEAELPAIDTPLGLDRGPAAIIRLALQRPGEVTLVALGPLTNIAIALNVCPELPSLLKRLVIMGGAYRTPGNRTPYAEFNMLADPEAAEQVFGAKFSDGMVVGLDVTHQTLLHEADWHQLAGRESALPKLMYAICRRSFTVLNMDAFPLHDPLTTAAGLDPTLVTTVQGTIAVVVGGERDGQTVLTGNQDGRWRVALGVDAERFVPEFLASYGLTQ
jgi:purine nucleosidase